MFVADAFLSNFDHHNGNWGVLIDEQNQCVDIAPIYDCGSCLYPQLDEMGMQKVLGDEKRNPSACLSVPDHGYFGTGEKRYPTLIIFLS